MARNSRYVVKGYGLNSPYVDVLPLPLQQDRDPQPTDSGHAIGQVWINVNSLSANYNDVWILTSVDGGIANWEGFGNDTDGGVAITKYVVDANGGTSVNYTTIQAAINTANTAGVDADIYVRPGTYTENLVLYDGINVIGTDNLTTIITGVHTPPATGSFKFDNLTLNSATSIFSSAVAGTATLMIEDCFGSVVNGYIFDLVNWTGDLIANNDEILGTTNGIINNTGGASFTSSIAGLGAGAGVATVSGVVSLEAVDILSAMTIQGAGALEAHSGVYFGGILTTAGTSTVLLDQVKFVTGAAAAISHGSAGTFGLYNSTIDSANATPIGGAGAGVMDLGSIDFVQNSAIAGTLTVTYSRATDRISPYIVGPTGNFATIQAALTAADASGADQTVYVQPGTYTENLTLYDGINIRGNDIFSVVINGTHVPPAAGAITIENCTLASATDVFSSAVAGTAVIYLHMVEVQVANGYLFNLANWTGSINIDTISSLGGTTDGFVNNTGVASVFVSNSDVGAGAGISTLTGTVTYESMASNCAITIQGAGNLSINGGSIVSGTITTAGTSTLLLANSYIVTGAAAAVSHGSAGVCDLKNSVVVSTNSPAIDGVGAGVLMLTGVEFVDNAQVAATLTLDTVPTTRTTNLIARDADFISTSVTNTNIESFDVNPILQSAATTGAAPTGATGDTNIMYLQDGTTMNQFVLGAGQTIIAPRLADDGLLISLDLTDNEGAEYLFGYTTRSRHAFTVGTSKAFFMEATFKVADAGGCDPLFMGFRKLAAPNADYTTYTDAGFIGLHSTTNADTVIIGSNLNNAGWAYVNTTDAWADGETHTLRVDVSLAGVVTYLIDGVAPSVTQALTLDATDVVIPVIHALHGAAAPGAIYIQSLKCGYQNWDV